MATLYFNDSDKNEMPIQMQHFFFNFKMVEKFSLAMKGLALFLIYL